MYCVKCGVKLQDGVKSCPLCQTPVWCPEELKKTHAPAYSALYPEVPKHDRVAGLSFVTMVLAAVCLACLIICLNTFGRVAWSGYVMLGLATVYVIAVLPLWFQRPHPLIFVPLSFFAVCGYLLFICLYNHGTWFLSFAFPVLMLLCLLSTASTALFRYVKRGKLFTTGGLLIAIGGSTMLIELFQHITFHTPMFTWSLYTVSVFGLGGLFLILSGIIRPLREYLERKFFL